VPRCRLARARLGTERRKAHDAHQPLHALAVDRVPFGPQHGRHPTRAQERVGREQRVDPAHQHQIGIVIGWRLWPINTRSVDGQQSALSAGRQDRMVVIEHGLAVRLAHRPDLLAKRPVPDPIGDPAPP
jgi:hypothetical protein